MKDQKEEKEAYLREHGIIRDHTTGCRCGRYQFYASGCMHGKGVPFMHRCGVSVSTETGGSILCKTPPPHHNVTGVYLEGYCSDCMDRNAAAEQAETFEQSQRTLRQWISLKNLVVDIKHADDEEKGIFEELLAQIDEVDRELEKEKTS
jgi:hypothetical protein